MTPSTDGPSARSLPVQEHEPSTTNTAPPATCTTKPCAPWATVSSASCTAAYATTPPTAKTPPGHIAKSPTLLDNLRPWDVYKASKLPFGNETKSAAILVGVKHTELLEENCAI